MQTFESSKFLAQTERQADRKQIQAHTYHDELHKLTNQKSRPNRDQFVDIRANENKRELNREAIRREDDVLSQEELNFVEAPHVSAGRAAAFEKWRRIWQKIGLKQVENRPVRLVSSLKWITYGAPQRSRKENPNPIAICGQTTCKPPNRPI